MADKWQALKDHHAATAEGKILDLFAADPARAAAFSVRERDMLFDYSKTGINAQARAMLLDLAEASGVAERRAAMFAGEKINDTEGRAVLHVALRAGDDAVIAVDGADVMPGVRATRARMASFAEDVRQGRMRGQGGRITDVVNIGIGGSDLGPAMAVLALAPYHDGPRVHFVSNVDGAHIADTLKGLNPETTLVIVASKTFTTIETMTNADTAKSWMAGKVAQPNRQFAAVSTAADKTAAYGIDPARVFGFEDWVGGRYSLWGPIGLALMIAIGPKQFDRFLAGARAMDDHFQSAPPLGNMPIMLALVGIWHAQIAGHASRAVLPYDQRLSRLPAYLQQLEMESNGKRVDADGQALPFATAPVLWGEPGTNGQHAYFQMLHQGTDVVPVEFVAVKRARHALPGHQPLLLANAVAQAQALMLGKTDAGGHKHFTGNRPSTFLLLDDLTPASLGALIALQEHRVFVSGSLWGINSFDQWGVELGKVLARDIEARLASGDAVGLDGSTAGLLRRLRAP